MVRSRRGSQGTVGMVRTSAMPAVKVSPFWVERTTVAPPVMEPFQPSLKLW